MLFKNLNLCFLASFEIFQKEHTRAISLHDCVRFPRVLFLAHSLIRYCIYGPQLALDCVKNAYHDTWQMCYHTNPTFCIYSEEYYDYVRFQTMEKILLTQEWQPIFISENRLGMKNPFLHKINIQHTLTHISSKTLTAGYDCGVLKSEK